MKNKKNFRCSILVQKLFFEFWRNFGCRIFVAEEMLKDFPDLGFTVVSPGNPFAVVNPEKPEFTPVNPAGPQPKSRKQFLHALPLVAKAKNWENMCDFVLEISYVSKTRVLMSMLTKQTTNKHVNHKGFTLRRARWKMLHCNELSFEAKRFQKLCLWGGEKEENREERGTEKKKKRKRSFQRILAQHGSKMNDYTRFSLFKNWYGTSALT